LPFSELVRKTILDVKRRRRNSNPSQTKPETICSRKNRFEQMPFATQLRFNAWHCGFPNRAFVQNSRGMAAPPAWTTVQSGRAGFHSGLPSQPTANKGFAILQDTTVQTFDTAHSGHFGHNSLSLGRLEQFLKERDIDLSHSHANMVELVCWKAHD
jgi:hypothetical protein